MSLSLLNAQTTTNSVHTSLSNDSLYNLTPPERYIGIDVSALLALHNSSFNELPGVPNCCPTFRSAIGLGYAAGLMYEKQISLQSLPLLGDALHRVMPMPYLGVRLLYASTPAPFRETEETAVLINGTIQQGQFTHNLDVSLRSVYAEFFLGKRNVWRSLSLHGGFFAAYTLKGSFEQSEHITEPQDRGVFTDNQQRIRNVFSGSLPNMARIHAGVLASAGWQLPLSSEANIIARPSLTFLLPFTNTVQQLSWKNYQVRAGVSLLFRIPYSISTEPEWQPLPDLLALNEKPSPPWMLEPKPLPTVQPPYKEIYLSVVWKNNTNQEFAVDTVNLRGYYERTLRPLLHYVFFEEGSATLAPRYVQLRPEQTASYTARNFSKLGMIETYHHLLNILGLRMKEMPETKITLTGCIAANTPEGAKPDLSRVRAEAVRNYLMKVWKISEERIRIVSRALPAKPSFIGNPDGDEENRRVEITSTATALLEPVTSTDTVFIPQPDTVYLRPYVYFDNVQKWSLRAALNDSVQKVYADTLPLQNEYVLPLRELVQNNGKKDTTLRFSFRAFDEKGEQFSTPERRAHLRLESVQQKAQRDTIGKIVEKYSLILFDFDDATFTPMHERTLEQVRRSLTPESDIIISGYTDRMGETDYNERLAEKRAKAVARALPTEKQPRIIAVGERSMLYDNNSPEGRFYCRTIDIRVEKPAH